MKLTDVYEFSPEVQIKNVLALKPEKWVYSPTLTYILRPSFKMQLGNTFPLSPWMREGINIDPHLSFTSADLPGYIILGNVSPSGSGSLTL